MKRYVFADTVKLDKNQRISLAQSTRNAALLYRLAFDKSEDVRAAVAGNKFAPPYVLKVVIDNSSGYSWQLSENLSKNAQLTDDVIEYAIDHDICTYSEHLPVILDRIKSPEVFVRLAQSEEVRVRQAVASNLSTPIEALDALAYDANSDVRKAIAARQDRGTEILEILAYDPDIGVRSIILQNPLTPKACVLDILDGLNYTDISSYTAVGGLLGVATRRDLTTEELDRLTDRLVSGRASADRGDRYYGDQGFIGIAGNRKTSSDALCKICSIDGNLSYDLCMAILNNPNAKSDVIAIFKDKINQGDIRNRDITAKVIAKTDDAAFIRAHCDDDGDCMNAAAKNIHTPKYILEDFASHREYYHERVRSDYAKKTLEALNNLSSGRAKSTAPRKASTTGWEVSPYIAETYADFGEELDDTVSNAVNIAAKALGTKLTYQFDVDDYDTANELIITTNDGKTATLDAQRFLAQLTSDTSKTVGAKKAAEYIQQVVSKS